MLKRGSRAVFTRIPLVRSTAILLALAVTALGLTASHLVSSPPRVELRPAPVAFDSCGADEVAAAATVPRPNDTELPDYEQSVVAGGLAPQIVAYSGAQVAVPGDALAATTTIGITALDGIATDTSSGDVPKLDGGMTDVTGSGHDGFRFTPHPMTFADNVELTLPYDPATVGDGFTGQEVFTYYYDDVALCWRELQRKSVDEGKHTVTSWTNHFTDFINATVTAPEHPENVSFNPNQIKGIQAANPGAGVQVMGPPQAGNQGDNQLGYPIDVPAGRAGLQPSLAVTYNSAAGNGWLGVGWSLGTPAVTIDTRWGAPRYDMASETETYLLNGEQLTPVANRGPAVARTSEKVFHQRVEGGFARIVRHGDNPASYTWEVVDKAGTHWFFGALPGATGPDAGATLADQEGRVSLWALREVRDPHGNFVRYSYATVNDTGLADGKEPGRNLYPQKITYTGSGDTEGRYAVTLSRDRDLGEPLRSDVLIDARSGFKRVTADRLRRIDVSFDNSLVRRYELAYTTGAFAKTLLVSITQMDDHGAVVGAHQFTYFDDVRDPQGVYQAFASADWTVPGDSLSDSKLNLTDDNAGDASALSASSSSQAGVHLYVGVGTPRGKPASVGVKVGSGQSSADGVLALVDVDGDNLPDKVFRKTVNGSSLVFYRKNLSGPNGETRFDGNAQQLSLPGIGAESSNSQTRGLEGYLGGVAAQLDYVNTFATTSQYFSDVNDDGINDLVNGTGVLFGRIGANGVPVYGISGDTPVPVTPGHVDTSGIVPDLGQELTELKDSHPLLDTVRRWVAPFDGVVGIEGAVALAHGGTGPADGVRVAIQKEDTELWSTQIDSQDTTAHAPAGVASVSVHRGDRIYFRVQSRDDGSRDEVSWNPVITYQNGSAGLTDINGLPVYKFAASADFTLGGRDLQVTAPLTGTVHLSGDLATSVALTDDVTALVTRDGVPVVQKKITAGAPGTAAVDLDINVQKGQILRWRVQIDSPVDLGKISWLPHATYTAADGVARLTDSAGRPLIEIFPPYNVDMYPVDGLTAPQGFFEVPVNGQAIVSPSLSFNFDGQKPSGQVTFTVKRSHGLVGKSVFEIKDGVVTAPGQLFLDVNGGDNLAFDFSAADPGLRQFLTSRSVELNFMPSPDIEFPMPEIDEVVPSALHSAAVADAFPQPYRGWAAIGYNGNGDRAGAPIAQGDLVVDDHFGDSLPSNVDPQAQQGEFGANPTVTPPKVIPFIPSPKDSRWGVGDDSWVTATGASSSRLGAASLILPKANDFAGSAAVPRLARSTQLSLTGSVGGGVGTVGGSIATGHSTGEVDFLDMNGDGFPNVVSGAGIQYSDPTGGLGDKRGSLPNGETAVRSSANQAGNASAGSPARVTPNGRGSASPTGQNQANTAQSGNDMQPLGAPVTAGDSLGASSSDVEYDLLDINGDGLPDRVYANGSVRLNLGYTFGQSESWRNPGPLNDGNGTNVGENLGFNTDFYGFAGGASFSLGSTSSATTMADLNGDGLPDRVFAGNPIKVAINTGNGFEPPVEFRGSRPNVNADQNAALGAGAYFVISICFIEVCAIINPGADGSVGASRSVQAMRDINGDGFADQLTSTKDNRLTVATNQTGRTNLLRGVARPLGGRMDFDYVRDGNTYGQPQSKFVLSRVSMNDGRPGDGADVLATTYEYTGGAYDRLEREFDGYATVVARQVDAGTNAVLRAVTRQYRTDGHYTRGLATRQVVTDPAGHQFVETVNTYGLRDIDNPTANADPASPTATIFPQLVRTDARFFEGQATAGKTTFSTMEYDAVGNMTHVVDAGDAGAADDVDTTIHYSVDDPACRTSNVVSVATAIDVRGGGNLLRHRESTVDCATGNITRALATLANGDAAVTDMAYFADGNLRTVINPANRTGQRYRLDYTYDGDVATRVASIVDSFGYRSSMTYDPKFGAVLTSTDENNQVVRNTYDSVGRLSTVVGPYEAPENRVTIAFEYHPEAAVPYAVSRHVDRQADNTVRADTIDTIAFIDGLGRVIQTKTDAAVSTGPATPPADVMTVSGRAVFDALGRQVQEFFPITEAKGSANTQFNPAFDPVQPTVTTFDVLNRATKTVLPDNTTTTVAYGFGPDRSGATRFETAGTDANGKTAHTYTDIREHITAVQQANPAGGHPVIWTSYQYDALGQLTAVTDDQNNTTTTAYDNLGRRTRITSPDAGRTDFAYDLAGDLTTRVTAKLAAAGQAVQYDYDFNRPKAIRYPVFTANNVTYTYGAPGAPNNGANRITSIIDGAGTLTREYGPLGEVTAETRTTDSHNNKTISFTTRYSFDTWNRMLKLTYPDGEVLSYHYGSGGQVDSAAGVKDGNTYNYLNRLDYDKFGQRVLLDTGNGTRTQYTYDSENQRLTTLKANLSQGYVFQNLGYTYDNVGNVTAITNDTVPPGGPEVGTQVGGPSTQTFQYDDLNQLVHAEGSYQSRNPQTDTYSFDLTYDSIHNITQKTQTHQLISNGNTVTDGKLTYSNAYGYPGASPHQAITIGGFTFAYDANGNQVSRTQQPGPRTQMIWDEDNHLACSHSNAPNTLPQTPAACDNPGGTPNDASYRYDDQGNRVVKDGQQLHIYPNQNYSTRGNFAFKHIYIGPTKLVTKTVESHKFEDQQFYSHGDQLGSTGFVTDVSGGLAEHLQYFPGGETWVDEHPSQPVPQQYTGKEFDPETNLYYYGARYYDPRTQQWQSPDPIVGSYLDGGPDQGVYNSINLSLYTYGNNNPVRYTDPNGQYSWSDFAWDALKVTVVVAAGVATAGLGAAVIGAGLAAGTTTGLVAATAVVAADAYVVGNAVNIAATGQDVWGNSYSTGDRVAAGVGAAVGVAAPVIASSLTRASLAVEPEAPLVSEPTPAPVPEPTVAPEPAVDPALFRGTSVGYAGSPGTQKVGITPTSTDPGVATIFATHSEQFGQGVVQVAKSGNPNLAGVARYPGYIAAEAEVGVEVVPDAFAQAADLTIPASQARSILGDMGISIPRQIGVQDLSPTLASTPKLTPEQITEFVCRAGDEYGQ